MQLTQERNRITTATTTVVKSVSCAVTQIVIAVQSGTSFTLAISDGVTPTFYLVPTHTLAIPTDGVPVIINFTDPVYMDSGIKIVTGGTGEVSVWISLLVQQ